MTQTTYAETEVPRAGLHGTTTGRRRRQGGPALRLLAAVVVLDQATKWWGMRHVPGAIVNTGPTWLIGDPVRGWVSGPVSGTLIDVLGLALLGVAGYVLLRRRRHPVLLVAGTLMIAGWSSNLLDRLGMHMLTAPGLSRGVADFIPVGRVYFNLADVAIAAATVLYLVARPVRPVPAAPAGQRQPVER